MFVCFLEKKSATKEYCFKKGVQILGLLPSPDALDSDCEAEGVQKCLPQGFTISFVCQWKEASRPGRTTGDCFHLIPSASAGRGNCLTLANGGVGPARPSEDCYNKRFFKVLQMLGPRQNEHYKLAFLACHLL